MKNKKIVKLWLLIVSIFLSLSLLINYIVNPYDIYNNKIVDLNKIKKHEKIRLVKAIKIKELKPKSIILGTSRAAYGFNPKHKYFKKPSYNSAIPGGTIYENLLYLKEAIKNGKLENVLLVLDFRMFNALQQKKINDIETYFHDDKLKYNYLLSLDQLFDSISTIKAKAKTIKIYTDDGFRKENITKKKRENQYKFMLKDEAYYYKNYPVNNIYKDTKRNSFEDFNEVLLLVMKYDLNLTIIFGPSHIRLWEAFDYYLDYNLWLKWKKDIVSKVSVVNNIYNKKISIFDFSIYNQYTDEYIPNSNKKMKYYLDSNHYNENLGKLVLDYINNDFYEENFAVKLNQNNIDDHLKKLKKDRDKFIDIEKYKKSIDTFIKNDK